MQISLTFRNTEAEDWLKEHVNKKLLRLKKYFDKPIEVKVILSVEKFRNVAEINLLAKGLNLNGKEEAKDMIVAIDNVIDKIERQLKKHKEKIRNRKENAIKSETATMNELSSESYQEDEDQPKIVEVRKIVLKPMSIDDAIMQLEESRNRFVVYRDSSSEKMNVIYKSDDGNYGLIEVKS
ncbi:MAG: ribosome-associated translation inhibitor RaiA [Syntrophobacterales bacterium]|nr:ribosome-associated translation inhibitor RaiA [Syntrophobacterales bacterium]